MALKISTTQQDTAEQAAVFGVLADPTRLRLIKLLCGQRREDVLCVNALAGILGVTQSAVSQHLRVLKSIGLVKGERRGYHMHYFVNQDMLQKVRKLTLTALNTGELDPGSSCWKICTERRDRNVLSS